VIDTVITDNRMVNNTAQITDAGTRTLQAWNFLTTDTTGKVSNVALTDTVTTYSGNTVQTADVATLITTVGVAGRG